MRFLDHEARLRIVLASLALASACGPERTHLTLDAPEHARGHLSDVRVEVWPADGNPSVCDVLEEWIAGTCQQVGCEGEPSFAALGEPLARLSIDGATGAIAGELPVDSSSPWSISVVARAEGALLLGCVRVVSSGAEITVELRHPWCEAPPCDGSAFHPDCRASLIRAPADCSEEPGFRTEVAVRCESTLPFTDTWTFGETSCAPTITDPPPGRWPAGLCQPARILCQPGMPVEIPLVCPVTPDVCLAPRGFYDPASDLDCDGMLEYCAGDCDPVGFVSESCSTAGGCSGGTACNGGTLICTVGGVPETCDSADNNCNGSVDEDPAYESCNSARSLAEPVADGCRNGRCFCGASEACTGSTTCCGGVCVDLRSDPLNCGRCGAACRETARCVGGACAPPPAPDGGTPECVLVSDCNFSTLPRADSCTGNECWCGRDAPCDAPGTACCGSTCVDMLNNDLHCGRCDLRCPTGCNMGVCRR